MNPSGAFMGRAIRLSRKGFPAPNPHVGCVIERDGEIVGEGYCDYAGGPHAEIVALRQAGERARGATVYVTLEPCNHHGRTPPCSEALIAAGVSEVVVACADPNPLAAGGCDKLQAAGIEVFRAFCEEDAAAANEMFLFAMALKRPYVVVKSGVSLDGRSALSSGESQWITGERARRQAHILRAECGAVLVGLGTIVKDDPRLTARIAGVVNQPVRIVLDPAGALTGAERVFTEPGDSLWLVRQKSADGQTEAPWGADGFDLPGVLAQLWTLGITGVLLEGGARTVGSFVGAKLFDRVELFVAPLLLGSGPSWVSSEHVAKLEDAPKLHFIRQRRLGDDLWITAKPGWASDRDRPLATMSQ